LDVSKDLEKKKLTDIGFFGFWLLKGTLDNWFSKGIGLGLCLDIGFDFPSDIGLIDYVSINFYCKHTAALSVQQEQFCSRFYSSSTKAIK